MSLVKVTSDQTPEQLKETTCLKLVDLIVIIIFSFTAFLFILAMFVMKGAPACSEKAINACTKPQGCLPNVGGSTHGAWRNTFALHALVATILHLRKGFY